MSRIAPEKPIPQNMFDTLDGRAWPMDKANKPRFYLLVAYRGVQCGFCKTQLLELDEKLSLFEDRKVEVIAVSADNKERAQRAIDEWPLTRLRLGYNLSLDAARKLGLYISSATKEVEMPLFTEPGMFLIAPDQTLFATWISSYPLARPQLDEIIRGIDFIVDNNRPPRGTVASQQP